MTTARTINERALPAGYESWMSVQQVAKWLGVPESWAMSRLPSHKLGKYRRFDPDEVREFLREQRGEYAQRGRTPRASEQGGVES